jgi:hypothetical protein
MLKKSQNKRPKRVIANSVLLNKEFLISLKRAEQDYREGRIRKIKSFVELRNL